MGFLVFLHNIFRWVVLVLAVIAIFRSYRGWLGQKAYGETDRKTSLIFSIALDVQVLLGIILWVISPVGLKVLSGTAGAAGTDRMVFYFALEHAVSMFVAVVLVHVGSITSKRSENDTGKHKRAAIWFTIAAVIILVSIPWWRPLIRGF